MGYEGMESEYGEEWGVEVGEGEKKRLAAEPGARQESIEGHRAVEGPARGRGRCTGEVLFPPRA